MGKFTADKKTIEKWKKDYGTIHEIIVEKESENGTEEVRAFIKDPYHNMNLLSSAVSMNDDPMKRNFYLLDNLWIDGDDAFKNDNKVRFAGAVQAYSVIEVLTTSVKKH